MIVNMKKQLLLCLAAVSGLLALGGCTRGQSSKLTNEIAFTLENVSEISISYDEENVTFYESDDDELIIKEYMTEDKSSYYARVDEKDGRIKISEGGKPLVKNGFTRYIEVYFPVSYQENLTVTTTDGEIDISDVNMSLSGLMVESTAGTIRLRSVKAQEICLRTTSGSLFAEELNGTVTYTTTSGSADIKSAVGCGDYRADNSGDLNVVYAEVTGDLSFLNKNDDIHVTLPGDLEFEFEAVTKHGSRRNYPKENKRYLFQKVDFL